MQKQALTELISYLEDVAAKVRRLEEEGDAVIETEGQLAFQAKLEEKAELLAALGEKAWKLTEAVGGELGKEIAARLEQFSMSASTSLRIGSVFFMTALLYPEDHQPGEPNDLETFITDLKGKL
ncbi:hypothetical protein GM415_12580 [Pseudodesulfovibrio cashew]|uniref:Uncharacterized protein n=1 Tax=Pseudodesulfovibrio cashew TaxID=2678688 RepID=A0A6I6JIM2_9BACT|nr:hypothetical protein [Pseudodesulfovibrio cashew]QGY40930.1 hypothetical protein GM415_12580 [Pseudodesulfovibrio cashew]